MPTIAEAIRKVNEFADLPEGWHFGEGVPSRETLSARARNLLIAAHSLGIDRANAFPGVGGQVQVTFYRGPRMLELTLETDGSVTIAEDARGEQVVFKEAASIEEAFTSLTNFGESLWISSDLSIGNITILNATTSQVRPLTSAPVNLSLWSSVAVPLLLAAPFASILMPTILSRPANLRFTGTFLMQSFPPAAASSKSEVPLTTIATTTSTAGLENKRGEPSSR